MSSPPVMTIDRQRLEQMLQRAKAALPGEDHELICALVRTVDWFKEQLARKDAKLAEMRNALLGAKSERTKDIKSRLDERASEAANEDGAADSHPELVGTAERAGDERKTEPPAASGKRDTKAKEKRNKGLAHGRNGAADFPGANKIPVPHPRLRVGDKCPKPCDGRLHRYEVSPHLYLFGRAPIGADLYECEQLRCGSCGAIFTAPAPERAQGKKHDETVPATVAMLRYGAGLPHYRLAKVQKAVGVPLPASTQWDLVDQKTDGLLPVFRVLLSVGAQRDLVHNDDTNMPVLSLAADIKAELAAASNKDDVRTGLFTTSVVCRGDGCDIALFFTGRRHAGENLRDLLLQRASDLGPVMQMCDGLERNLPKELETIVSNCLGHGRRNFVKVADNFPHQCLHVLDELARVYRVEALARAQGLDPEARLRLHQQRSGPVMDALEQWMKEQLASKKVEPNSGLGRAINYMLKRWKKLTLFLRLPGAAIDNNICERALKKAVLHRKNSLFYKTERGALAGDVFMTLIHTAELNGIDPLHYLTALMQHPRAVQDAPEQWLPWNYRQTLLGLRAAQAPIESAA